MAKTHKTIKEQERTPGRRVRKTGRKEEIIEAAAKLFSQKSYHDVTMDDIAEKVGVAKGTIGWPDYPEGSPSTIDWTTRAMEGLWDRPRWEERWFPQAFKGTMGQLMRAIQEDKEPAISGRTTLGTMTLVDAAYRSFREGRAVPLTEVRTEAGLE